MPKRLGLGLRRRPQSPSALAEESIMNMPWPDQKKLIAKRLIKGKESATQLQTLLQKPLENHASVSAADLAVQILRSFTDSLSVLGPNEIHQIAAADGSDRTSNTTAGHRKKPGVKDRRGSYRKRNLSDTWVKLSCTVEDEYAWRKYGQKEILNSEFPRCYFRCTHKFDQGCKATKQVQCLKQNPPTYQTTYIGHHTCNDILRAPHVQIIQESDPGDCYLPNFETKMPTKKDSLSSAINISSPIQVIKKEDTQSVVSDNKSLLDSTVRQDLVTSGSSGLANTGSAQLEEVFSSVYSCSSDADLGLDMEVFSKLADLDSSFYFEESNFFGQFTY